MHAKVKSIISEHLIENNYLNMYLWLYMYLFLQQQPLDVKTTVAWEEATPQPVCCTAQTAVLLHGNVYVGGGSQECFDVKRDYKDCYRLDTYNPITNQWSTPITTPYSWFAMTVLDNKLLIAGGIEGNKQISKKVLVLNAGHWEDYSIMPSAKCCATAVGYHSKLIIIGGMIQIGNKSIDLSTIWVLDITGKIWYACNNLPSPSSQLKAAIIDEKLYLLGGFSGIGTSSQVIYASLDNISNNDYKFTWFSLPNSPWHFSSAAVLQNNFLLTVGGRKPSVSTSQTCKVCVFNPSTDQWKCLANIPEERSLPAVVGMDDKIVVIGGTNANRKYSKKVWIGSFK